MIETWHRFEDTTYANPLNEFDEPTGVSTYIKHLEYPVLSHTPKGVWLDLGFCDKRFVRNIVKKCFACPTEEEAKVSFLARKEKQRAIYQAKADKASWIISKMKKEFPFDAP